MDAMVLHDIQHAMKEKVFEYFPGINVLCRLFATSRMTETDSETMQIRGVLRGKKRYRDGRESFCAIDKVRNVTWEAAQTSRSMHRRLFSNTFSGGRVITGAKKEILPLLMSDERRDRLRQARYADDDETASREAKG